jgi:hypothetical protein
LIEIRIGLFNYLQVQSSCVVTVDWAAPGSESWLPLSSTGIAWPPGVIFIPDAVVLVVPAPASTAQLRFAITDVCPVDVEWGNNIVFGTLPWFTGGNVPVAFSDLVATSRDDGVHLEWRAEPGADTFAIDRRRQDESSWQRLPATIAAATTAGAHDYAFVDRDAEAGARLEYRIVARMPQGEDEFSAVIAVEHTAARAVSALGAVTPQPFRAGGSIEFSLRDAGPVDLVVYDSAGRRVAVLRRGTFSAGRHTVGWDGRDAAGRRVPAGVYFCRFTAGGLSQSRRVVLVH